jgi:hypothetical protein
MNNNNMIIDQSQLAEGSAQEIHTTGNPIRTHGLSSIFFSLLHRVAPTHIFFFDIATEILSESSTYVVEWT